MATQRMSFDLRSKTLMDKCRAYCKQTGMKHVDLAEIALRQFFENEKKQLMALTKEQLVDLLLQNEKNQLMALTKEQLVDLLLQKGESDNGSTENDGF
jgi:hypothetical protein